MTEKDKLRFQELQVIFFMSVRDYPNDNERLQKMYAVFYKFVDSIVEKECSKIFSQASTLKIDGKKKGGGFTN